MVNSGNPSAFLAIAKTQKTTGNWDLIFQPQLLNYAKGLPQNLLALINFNIVLIGVEYSSYDIY